MPPSNSAKTYEQRCALADKEEAYQSAKLEVKKAKPSKTYEERCALADKKEANKRAKLEAKPDPVENRVARALAKYEKLTQETLAKLPQPGPSSKEEPAPAPAPMPAPAPAPAVVNLITEDDIPTEEED